MKLSKRIIIIGLVFAFSSASVLADEGTATDKGLGERLLRQLWEDMKKADMEGIEKTMAEGFQSVHQDGANSRAKEMKLIRGLKLGDYTLSNIEITRNGPVLVATYFVSVEETIEGKRLTKEPAPRLSVFVSTESGWKWIAHANLKPLK